MGNAGDAHAGEAGRPPSCDAARSPSEQACVIDERYGVFVSPKGDDDGGDGSRGKPFATLDKAVAEAKAKTKRVYACGDGGPYRGALYLDASASGLELYGGFSCSDWSYDTNVKSQLLSSTTSALRVDKVAGLTIDGFGFEAAERTLPGESSLGAIIANSTGVVLRRVHVKAGAGAAGLNGTGTSTPAAAGAEGHHGVAACTVTTGTNAGGPATESACAGSIGGKGGDGGNDDGSAGNGDDGKPTNGNQGAGGFGESSAIRAWDCAVGGGGIGVNGESQAPAVGAVRLGTLTPTEWKGEGGQDGEDGTPGQGGGGGGGAKAPATCDAKPRTGASGGSGGGGGCGGSGGRGGQAGGSSIALALFFSEVTLADAELVAGDGGKGGDGGQGQPGGKPGLAGAGGSALGAGNGCQGGDGGTGGDGGPGGGAAGGVSVGIVWKGTAPPTQTNVTFEKGVPGGKGRGGSAGVNDGIDGIAPDVLESP